MKLELQFLTFFIFFILYIYIFKEYIYNVFKELLSSLFITDHFVPLIYRLGCLVVLVAVIIQSSSFVLDLTQFGDVEKNPGPKSAL